VTDERSDRQILDPRNLRGLAHPLRVRLLSLLRSDGPSTATRLAEQVGQSSGATSYHLRQLAAHGFVVEDEERTGPGRERWWKATAQWSSLPATTVRQAPDEAEGVLRALVAEHFLQVDGFLAELATQPAAWDESWALNDTLFRLTPAEAKRLIRDVRDVLVRYRSDPPAPGDAVPSAAERVTFQFQVLPQLGRGAP
jgi:DNA-binding transcriptional ArsR family regulator